MKRKLLWSISIIIVTAGIVIGGWQFVEMRHRQTDPNWKLAQQIFNVENALKELDEDYECKSISKVTPYTYADLSGNMITYYCCQTTYTTDGYGENTGLNTEALGMVVDFAKMENKRECKINEYDAFRCEIEDRSYPCWTLSSEN